VNARLRVTATIGVVAAALPAVALAQHPGETAPVPQAGAQVVIRQSAVDPLRITALAGEEVQWLNASLREHTVTSRDGLFDSGRISPGRRFGYTFAATGSFGYFCRIHPFIAGVVDVANVLLHPPAGSVVRGDALMLEGRARPAALPVTIERDAGGGFAPVASVARAADGTFAAQVLADATANYRAVAGPDASPAVHVDVVAARNVTVTVQRARHRQVVRVRVSPALPGGTVKLQRWVRERFGWWTTRTSRLAVGRTAKIDLPRGLKGPARVVITTPDAETPAATAALRLRG
jgi:plastocyanin